MYRTGHYETKIFRDGEDDYNTRAEDQLANFLNHLSDNCRNDYQDFQIKNISMSVDNGKTSILLVLRYV